MTAAETITSWDIATLQAELRARSVSAVEVTEAYLAAIARDNAALNAYITVTGDAAREQARHADTRLAAGEARGLEGVPLAIKDLFCTRDVRTTAGSRMLEDFVPPYESTVTQRLREAGCIMLGKANLDEFAMGSANTTSYYGPVHNPRDHTRVPGGSSGGSAAAMAAGLCAGALGTDTGGSIRQPAALCGTVGFKPSYGRCSRYGIIAFASSLDQAGPITRTVADAALLFEHMAGPDPRDATCAPRDVPDTRTDLRRGVRGLRIGIPAEYRLEGMDPEIDQLWKRGIQALEAEGAVMVPISLPHTRYALPAYYIIAPAEASSNLARYDGVRYGLRVMEEGDGIEAMYERTRAAGFGAEVKRRLMIGTYVLSAGYYDAYYKKAQQVRGVIMEEFTNAFNDVDLLLTPTAPHAAFPLGGAPRDPVSMYLNDIFTVPASLAGLPGISVPAGHNTEGLPLGLQLLGPRYDEATVLRAAYSLEQAVSAAT